MCLDVRSPGSALKMWLIPRMPHCFATFWMGPPLLGTEVTAFYLHQIISLYTPPHWPYLSECPESDGQRSHSHPQRPSLVSVEEGNQKQKMLVLYEIDLNKEGILGKACWIFNTHRDIHIFWCCFHLKWIKSLNQANLSKIILLLNMLNMFNT